MTDSWASDLPPAPSLLWRKAVDDDWGSSLSWSAHALLYVLWHSPKEIVRMPYKQMSCDAVCVCIWKCLREGQTSALLLFLTSAVCFTRGFLHITVNTASLGLCNTTAWTKSKVCHLILCLILYLVVFHCLRWSFADIIILICITEMQTHTWTQATTLRCDVISQYLICALLVFGIH